MSFQKVARRSGKLRLSGTAGVDQGCPLKLKAVGFSKSMFLPLFLLLFFLFKPIAFYAKIALKVAFASCQWRLHPPKTKVDLEVLQAVIYWSKSPPDLPKTHRKL
jgi:hypothetical protein